MSTAQTLVDPVHVGLEKWLTDNEKYFLPPVCNKMMHNTQLKVFYVGGPNQRKDYHLEEGEELFFMKKGDMCLKIVEGGRFKDVHIKEGEVFLLPGRIPHSPQRQADTVGLVIERERLDEERDGLRYYVEGTTDSLYEKWFYCDDLGSQLGPIIKAFFASEQHKTGKPIPSEIPANPPWQPDSNRVVDEPFSLDSWLDRNAEGIRREGRVRLFGDGKGRYQSDIFILGRCDDHVANRHLRSDGGETFLWQLRGSARVDIAGKGSFMLVAGDTLLLPKGAEYVVECERPEAAVMSVLMDPISGKDRLMKST